MGNDDPPILRLDLIRTLVANDQLRNRKQHVLGIQVAGEQDVELFPLEEMQHDPLFQNDILSGAEESGKAQEPLQQHQPAEEGRQQSYSSPGRAGELNAAQLNPDVPYPDGEHETASMQGEEAQAAIIHRPPSSPVEENNAMEADDDTDEEIKSLRLDHEADLSDKYPVVSSPGSSHSSRHSTPVNALDAKPDQEYYSQLERVEMERIEKSICLSEEVSLIKSLDDSLCRAEENDLMERLEGRIRKVEMHFEKLGNSVRKGTFIKAASNVPRLLPGSRDPFITTEFLTTCTNSFKQTHQHIRKETKFKTYLTEIAGRPQTWKLNVEGNKKTVELFFAYWGKYLKKYIVEYNILRLLDDGIELDLNLDVTLSLGVRVENAENQVGLLVLKKGSVFEGQLTDIVSPENLSTGAVILSANGSACKNVAGLKNSMEEVRKAGAEMIRIVLCVDRSVDLGRIDQTAMHSLPRYRSDRRTIALPPTKTNHQIIAQTDQRRVVIENSRKRKISAMDTSSKSQIANIYNSDDLPVDRLSKRRKEDTVAQSRKRVRNDQSMDMQTEAPFTYTSLLSQRTKKSANQGGELDKYRPSNRVAAKSNDVVSIPKTLTARNADSREANLPWSRSNCGVHKESIAVPASSTLKPPPGFSGPLRISDFLRSPRESVADAAVDRQVAVSIDESITLRDANTTIGHPDSTGNAPPQPSVRTVVDSNDATHIDIDHQETFKMKFDSVLPLGFYCMYDRTSRSCRVVSVCPTGQASKNECVRPGTKLIGVTIEQMQVGEIDGNELAAKTSVRQHNQSREKSLIGGDVDGNSDSYKDEIEIDGSTGVRHIWGPRDLLKHLRLARTKGMSVQVWFANDFDNPYITSWSGRFREARWGDEGEWKGPNFGGWDGMLPAEAYDTAERSDPIPVEARKVHFSQKDSTRLFFRNESVTSEPNYFVSKGGDEWNRGSDQVLTAISHFESLHDAISSGTVFDLIEYIHSRSDKKEELTIHDFTEAREMTKRNECIDADMKDKLLKICARTLYAINLARAFRFWEKFEIHVVAIRNLQLPHSVKHVNCSIYLVADQVSSSDTLSLPASQSCPWNARFIEIPDISYPVSFNKNVDTKNRKTIIRVMATSGTPDTAICVGTVEITESNLSTFKADGEFHSYSRMSTTIIGEPFYVDFRVSRIPTPDERRKKIDALKYIREGVSSIQSFNKDLDESMGIKLSVDMHFSTEKHFTLLHAAIALYDVPTFKKVLDAGANPFAKTPFCSPFAMAQRKLEHLAGVSGENQQRRKMLEEMIAIMRNRATNQKEHLCLNDQDSLQPTGSEGDVPETELMLCLQDTNRLPDGQEKSRDEEAGTVLVTPLLSHPCWLELQVQNPLLCKDFEATQNCPRHDQCPFIHRYKSFGDYLPLVLEKSLCHPVPDHEVDCFHFREEISSTGQLWFTSGYSSCTKHVRKQIVYAEGGQNGVLNSSQNVWWYPTKADALRALHRVMAACDWAAIKGNDSIPHHRKTRVEMERLPASWTSLSKRRNGRCKYWPRCRKSDHECTFFHGCGPFDAPDEKTKNQIDQRRSTKSVPYDVRFVARQDLREGRWYHTARYRLADDDGLRYVQNYRSEGFYDNKNEIFWFDSENKVRAAVGSEGDVPETELMSCLQDNDRLPSADQEKARDEESGTDLVTPLLSHPGWLELQVQNPLLCKDFEATQSCPRHDQCPFIHRYKSFGDYLPLVLEKSLCHPVPDHEVDCFHFREEISSTGQLWFTSGYSSCTKHARKQIFYAEGGQNGVLNSSQNVWWYPTKADALHALHRVMAACDWATMKGNDAIPHRRKTVDMELLEPSWTGLSKRRNGRCKYWPRCRKSDHECTFFHGYGPFDAPDEKTKNQIDQGRSARGGPYDVRFVARKDLREGRWYHTARYRLYEDGELRYVQNYRSEGFYDRKNELFWFDSEAKVRAAVGLTT